MSSVAEETRRTVAGVLLCGAWVAFFVSFHATQERWTVWLVVPITMLAVALLQRHPLYSTVFIIIATGVSAWSGVPYGDIDLLLPTLFVLAHLGRFHRGRLAGPLAVLAIGVLLGLRNDAPWYAIPVATIVHGAAWLFGLEVRRRAQQAADASRESSTLAAVDLERVMGSASRAARQRATTEALTVLRAAVARMCELADGMRRRGTPYSAADAEAVRLEGDLAIGRLHDTLTLLDGRADTLDGRGDVGGGPGADASPHGASDADGAGLPITGRSGASARFAKSAAWPRWGAPAIRWWVGGAVLVASVGTALLVGAGQPLLLVAAAGVSLCTFAVHRIPFIAALIAAVCFGLVALAPAFSPDALLPLSVGLGVLVWQLTRMSPEHGRIPLAIVSIGAVLLGIRFDRQGVGFVIVVIALTFLAAVSWKEPDEILQAEQARATRLLAGIAAATRRAERAERTLLARELHDGVSHGITAMSLQVGAAHALGTVDPERARRSMSSAIDLGVRTLDEIDNLARGRPDEEDRSGLSLDTLIEGARTSGLRIRHRPVGEADLLSYRIVQEALTNITRYAPGSQVVIETGDARGRRFVRITDSGAAGQLTGARQAMERLGRGRGLPGLADRVAERGGRFRAGPLRTGFEVYAEWGECDQEAVQDGHAQQTETEI